MWPNAQLPVDLFTFTEEMVNQKLHFKYNENAGDQHIKKQKGAVMGV